MKICPKCNVAWGEDVQFCAACGEPLPNVEPTPVEEPAPAAEPTPAAEPAPAAPAYQPPQAFYAPQSEEEPVSTGKWLLYQLIPFIPIAGSIIYIVMLFVWSFGDSAKNKTFRNWARSNLILMGISLGLSILLIIFVIVFSVGIFGALESGSSYSAW